MDDQLSIKKSELFSCIEYEILFDNICENDFLIDDIIYNTNSVKKDTLFVCLKGANFDTNDENVIVDIINKGVKIVVCEKKIDVDFISKKVISNKKYQILKVDNTRKILSLLSINYFRNPLKNIILIGITGTKGKTTTSFMIKSILEQAGYRVGLIGTVGFIYDNKIIKTNNTTPESYLLQKFFYILQKENIKYAIIEASSQGFKLFRTYGIHFDYAVWTNISEDHIGKNEHKDFDEYYNCKLQIFNDCSVAVLNEDDVLFNSINQYVYNKNVNKVLFYSAKNVNKNIKETENAFGVEFETSILSKKVIISMSGIHNVYNALSAITVCKDIGIDENDIIDGLNKVSVPGRVEVIVKNDDYTVLVDYAHNELGAKMLIESIREYKPKRIVVVFGCGGNRDVNRRYGMGNIVGSLADFSIVTADNSRFEQTIDIINGILTTLMKKTDKYIVIEDRREAIRYAINKHNKGDVILVIGKGHEDYNDFNGVKTHFSDKEEILKAIKDLAI